MKGYKAFKKDLKCRNFQYEIGNIYELDGEPVICEYGFHFCLNIADCYQFYEMSDDTRICEIEALGKIVTDTDSIKYCTNKIKIIREIKNDSEKRALSTLFDTQEDFNNFNKKMSALDNNHNSLVRKLLLENNDMKSRKTFNTSKLSICCLSSSLNLDSTS